MKTTIQDIAALGTIVFVGAHPDDETFLCGGILAAACKQGQRVMCVTATRGEEGQDAVGAPEGQLGKVRSNELEAALAALGVHEHQWLAYDDGACAAADQDVAVRTISELLARWQPDTVLTFGPDGLTGHEDHQTVCAWTAKALQQIGSKAKLFYKVEAEELYEPYLKPIDEAVNFYFKTDKPPLRRAEACDIYFELPPDLLEAKFRALAAMPSQTQPLLDRFPQDFLHRALGVEAFVRAKY